MRPETDNIWSLIFFYISEDGMNVLDPQTINDVIYFAYREGIFQGSLKGTAAAQNSLFNY